MPTELTADETMEQVLWTAQEMLRWPLEWLQTRGLAMAKSLHIDVSESARVDVPEVAQR